MFARVLSVEPPLAEAFALPVAVSVTRLYAVAALAARSMVPTVMRSARMRRRPREITPMMKVSAMGRMAVRRRPALPMMMVVAAMSEAVMPPIVMMPPMVPIVWIHHDDAAAPVAIVVQPPAYPKCRAERDPGLRVINNRPLDIDDLWIVARHINDIGLRR